ncbi:MAG: galactose mutarotase [Phycisphaerae bacterium]|nr:galactose mutarotase [Phycisphaerae bacterium]
MGVSSKPFGVTGDGEQVELFTLTNARGHAVRITNYGAIVTHLEVPDRDGEVADVVLGFDTLDEYLASHPYFGAVVGRLGNRLAGGKFTLDGLEYTIAQNDGPNSLHGGLKGFDKVLWQAEPRETPDGPALVLSYVSADGEEGYPGELSVRVTYTWTNRDVFRVEYQAETTKPTVLNVTQHSYFNLAGAGAGDVLGHELQIFGDRFTPIDETLIPTGELRGVAGTPLDFRTPHVFGERIGADDEQLANGGGYDHNYVLNSADGSLARAVRVVEPTTGRAMEVWTTEPGVQLYSGNFLDSANVGKSGKTYHKHYGFCLETQHFPDSPNHPEFPSVVLRPGQTWRTTTEFRFSAGG